MTTIVVATRSSDKLCEIRETLAPLAGLRLIDLDVAGVGWTPAESNLEAFNTFDENALAKARFFARRSGHTVLADDSGLCVDALDGAPGVFSKRFSRRSDLTGIDLDLANNQHLLDRLDNVPDPQRSARYVCVIAIATPDGDEYRFRGAVDGLILREPRGSAGFGYDPLFFYPPLDATFAEIPLEVKNRVSHRAGALESALPTLRRLSDTRSGAWR